MDDRTGLSQCDCDGGVRGDDLRSVFDHRVFGEGRSFLGSGGAKSILR